MDHNPPSSVERSLTCGVHLAGSEQHATKVKLKAAVAGEACRRRGHRPIDSCGCDDCGGSSGALPGAACIKEAREPAGGQYGAAGPRRYR